MSCRGFTGRAQGESCGSAVVNPRRHRESEKRFVISAAAYSASLARRPRYGDGYFLAGSVRPLSAEFLRRPDKCGGGAVVLGAQVGYRGRLDTQFVETSENVRHRPVLVPEIQAASNA